MMFKLNFRQIQFIYFDVGGVVIRDFSKTDKWDLMLKDLGIEGDVRKEFENLFHEFEPQFCTGLELDVFERKVEKDLGINFPSGYSMLSDFVNRFERNESLWRVLHNLKKKFRLGLLTNIYPGMFDLIKQNGLMPEIEWGVVIDSSVEGCSKPGSRIFEIAEQRAQVSPEQVLFVENTQRHIDTAKKRGWQTFLYDSGDVEKASKVFRNLLRV